MKTTFLKFIIICSITSFSIYCQNNLDKPTTETFENAKILKEKLSAYKNEGIRNLTINEIQAILIGQSVSQDTTLIENIKNCKNAHKNLEIIALWFEQEKTIDDWVNYFAIHNQMITAIKKELKDLKACPELCQKIGKRIITIFTQAIQNFCTEDQNKKEIFSLIPAQEDFIQLFKL